VLRTASAAIVAAVGGWVLYTFPPTAYGFYPKCVFFTMTGLQCPGCGITRASHHLLHGRFEEAFQMNPMLFVLLALAVVSLPAFLRGGYPAYLTKPWFAWGAFFVLTAFWIVRNTPLYPL
jgi:hypothetical protein